MNKRPGGNFSGDDPDAPRRSQLIPVMSKNVDFLKKGYIIPFAIVLAICYMTNSPFLWFLAIAISVGTFLFIYRLCGKTKPSWLLMGTAGFTFFFLYYWGNYVGQLNETLPQLVAPGLVEEVVKAIPILIALFAGRYLLSSPLKEAVGVFEPLDGVILGAASAVGFALEETLLNHGVTDVNLLVTRLLGDVAGHIAYAGFLGYAIGLAVLKPKNWTKTVLIGYLVAAGLHDIWDAFCDSQTMAWVAYADAFVSYGFLVAACQKARELSPNQNQLKGSFVMDRSMAWASKVSQVWSSHKMTPPVQPPARPKQPAVPYNFKPIPPVPAGGFLLKVNEDWIPLSFGSRLTEKQLPGLESRTGDGVVAEVSRNPQDPSVLGLKNLSAGAWMVTDAARQAREVPFGKSLRLDSGGQIDFGPMRGEVVK